MVLGVSSIFRALIAEIEEFTIVLEISLDSMLTKTA